jgi:hypothetical protein
VRLRKPKPNPSWWYETVDAVVDDGQIDVTSWFEDQTPERLNVAMDRAWKRYIESKDTELEDLLAIELTSMAAYDLMEGEVLLGHRIKVVQEDGTIEYQAV